MISIITGITTSVTMSQIMNYSIIVVITLLLFFSVRNVIRGEISNQRKIGILMCNLNIVSIPLLIIFITIMAYKMYTVLP